MESERRKLKCAFIGDFGVGKTTLVMRLTEGVFTENTATIMVDTKIKEVQHKGRSLKVVLTDTAGQERFKTMTSSFYRHAHALIIMYDISDFSTFEGASAFVDESSRFAESSLRFLVGTKSDLAERAVTTEEAREYHDSLGFDGFFELSSKTGEGVNEFFEHILDQLVEELPEQPQAAQTVGISGGGRTKKKPACIIQ